MKVHSTDKKNEMKKWKYALASGASLGALCFIFAKAARGEAPSISYEEQTIISRLFNSECGEIALSIGTLYVGIKAMSKWDELEEEEEKKQYYKSLENK